MPSPCRPLVGSLFALSCLLSLPQAQNPRDGIKVDSSANAGHPTVVSKADRTVLAYVDNFTTDVCVVVSDGQALSWSAPVVISNGFGRKTLEPWSVHLVDGKIFVGWKDERNGNAHDEVFYNIYEHGAWRGEGILFKGYPQGVGAVRDWRMAVARGSGGVNVHFAMSVDPDTVSKEELYVLSSQDAGLSFNGPIYLPSWTAQAFDVDNLDLAAEGDEAYVVWADNRSGLDDLYLQKTSDGGATWSAFATEKQIDADSTGDVEDDPTIDVQGSLVAVGWLEERPDGSNDQLRSRVSTNGALSFGADVQVGDYTPGLFDVDSPMLRFASNGDVVAAWIDIRTGFDNVYTATLPGPYSSWGADSRLSTSIGAGGGDPLITTGNDGEVALLWSEGATPNSVECVLSLDDGATWSAGVTLSDPAFDSDGPHICYGGRYRNLICTWLSNELGTDNVYVGGWRLPTLTAHNFYDGGMAHFDLSGFRGSSSSALVLLSDSPFPPLRVRQRYVLPATLSVPGAPAPAPMWLGARLNGAGSESTTPFPLSAPSGSVFWAVGMSLDPAGPFRLAEITDVQEITVP